LGYVFETPMNALESKIHRLIEVDGPMSVALYMALCLGDPRDGYYMRQEAFGTKGDFITAPEVSQLFGEMVGVCVALNMDQFAADQPVTLVELGPGRGTLMADVLRTLKQLRPKHFEVLNVALVETSPRLRDLQKTAIVAYREPVFHDSIATLPENTPLLVIGNEFLDALPTRQYVKAGAAWRERTVAREVDKLVFALGASTLLPSELPPAAARAREGAIFEIAPARIAVIEELAQRLNAQGGTALFIDYGHRVSGLGDTLQAIHAHQFAPVLEAPGEVDLTSHIDFEPLQKAALAAGCKSALKTQSEFLLELGLLERAGAFGAGKSPEFQADIQAAVERLAGSDQMGDLFKVLCFGNTLPPPFENAYA
jgi:SAM-dependent MidA family methyltransferase